MYICIYVYLYIYIIYIRLHNTIMHIYDIYIIILVSSPYFSQVFIYHFFIYQFFVFTTEGFSEVLQKFGLKGILIHDNCIPFT